MVETEVQCLTAFQPKNLGRTVANICKYCTPRMCDFVKVRQPIRYKSSVPNMCDLGGAFKVMV